MFPVSPLFHARTNHGRNFQDFSGPPLAKATSFSSFVTHFLFPPHFFSFLYNQGGVHPPAGTYVSPPSLVGRPPIFLRLVLRPTSSFFHGEPRLLFFSARRVSPLTRALPVIYRLRFGLYNTFSPSAPPASSISYDGRLSLSSLPQFTFSAPSFYLA